MFDMIMGIFDEVNLRKNDGIWRRIIHLSSLASLFSFIKINGFLQLKKPPQNYGPGDSITISVVSVFSEAKNLSAVRCCHSTDFISLI